MNVSSSVCAIVFYIALAVAAMAQKEPPLSRMAVDDAVQKEAEIIVELRDAVANGDTVAIDAKLNAAPHEVLQGAPGAHFARRAAAVCAWLRNDGESERAAAQARRAIRQLNKFTENHPVDQVERGYWEAWLHAEILNDREAGLALLKQIELLAPEDRRIIDAKQAWADSKGDSKR